MSNMPTSERAIALYLTLLVFLAAPIIYAEERLRFGRSHASAMRTLRDFREYLR